MVMLFLCCMSGVTILKYAEFVVIFWSSGSIIWWCHIQLTCMIAAHH
jgi:hypothetical protein